MSLNLLMLVLLLIVSIGAPLGYGLWLWRLDEPSRAEWLLRAADASVFVALVFLVGRWDIAGLYTGLTLLVLSARPTTSRPASQIAANAAFRSPDPGP